MVFPVAKIVSSSLEQQFTCHATGPAGIICTVQTQVRVFQICRGQAPNHESVWKWNGTGNVVWKMVVCTGELIITTRTAKKVSFFVFWIFFRFPIFTCARPIRPILIIPGLRSIIRLSLIRLFLCTCIKGQSKIWSGSIITYRVLNILIFHTVQKAKFKTWLLCIRFVISWLSYTLVFF